MQRLETYYHPGVVFTHLAIKVALLTTYLLCELLNNGAFVINFVLVVLLQAVEFWYVKNVSGRKLVGLRYWNYTSDAGENEWQFESRDPEGMAQVQVEEKRLFWTTLYVMPALWTLFSIVSLLKLSLGYLMLCLIGLSMSATNVVGFTKSSKEAKAEISAGVTRLATRYALSGTGLGGA